MFRNRLSQRARVIAVPALALAGAAVIGVSSSSARPAAEPAPIDEPTVSGAAVVGQVLQGNKGLWTTTKDVRFTFQWLQCKPQPTDDSSSSTCKSIAGATEDEYTVRSDDLGKRLRFRVKATNNQGSGAATSAPTSVVQSPGNRPVSTYPPVIVGSAIVGQTLKTTTGSWAGTRPLTYSYQWARCDKLGNACAPIGGATSPSYKVKEPDTGRTFRTRVLAKNSYGSGDAYSARSDVVQNPGGSGGIVELPNGEKSVDAKDVPRDQRLVVSQVVFSPNPATSRTAPILAQIKVTDTRGYVVRNAIVFIRATPTVTTGGNDIPTATDGWVSYQLTPKSTFPKSDGNVQFFVKAYRKGDPELGGIYGSRLVQVAVDL